MRLSETLLEMESPGFLKPDKAALGIPSTDFKSTKYEDIIGPTTTISSFGSTTDEWLPSMSPQVSASPKRNSDPSMRSKTPSVNSFQVLSMKKPLQSPKAAKGGLKKQQDGKTAKEDSEEASLLGHLSTSAVTKGKPKAPKKNRRVSSPPLLLSTVPAIDRLNPKAKSPKTYTGAKLINKINKYNIQLPSEHALLRFKERLQPEIRGPMTVKHDRKEHIPPIHVAQDAHFDQVLYCFHNGSRLTQEELNEELREVTNKDSYNWFEEPCSTADPMRESIYKNREFFAKRGSAESRGSSQSEGSMASSVREEQGRHDVPLIESLDLGDAFVTNGFPKRQRSLPNDHGGSITNIEESPNPFNDSKALDCEANADLSSGDEVTDIQDHPHLVNENETNVVEETDFVTNDEEATLANENPFVTSNGENTNTDEGHLTTSEEETTDNGQWRPFAMEYGRETKLTMSQKVSEKAQQKKLRQSNDSNQAPFASDVRNGEVSNDEELTVDNLNLLGMSEEEAAEAVATSRDEVNDVIECYSPSVYSDEGYEML